jgi:hypothetical protein
MYAAAAAAYNRSGTRCIGLYCPEGEGP